MDAGSFMYCRGWSQAKPGDDGRQNQDAFATRLVPDAAGGTALLAICDGASSTVFAGPWARTLAEAAEPGWPDLDDDALTARLDAVRERFPLTLPEDLPWPVAHKIAREGSQATLMVAAFTRHPGSDDVGVRTVAVGDSSLILFRRGGSTAAFPLESSADYGLSPRLVSTKPQPGLRYERWDTVLAPGDVLLGCTDAVGKWALQGIESADQQAVFRLLLEILDDSDPAAGAPAARPGLYDRITLSGAPRQLEEDDVTLVLCVPVPWGQDGADAPLGYVQKVLNGHLTGDFELSAEPEPSAEPGRSPAPERPAALPSAADSPLAAAWRALRAAWLAIVRRR